MTSTVEMEDVAPWVEWLARVGFAAKGVLYITVGIIAAQAGLGPGGGITDTHGALTTVHHLTFGGLLLYVIAAGLIGYAVWRVVEAVVDPDGRGSGPKGLALRTSFAVRGVFHGTIGVAAFRMALGDSSAGSGNGARDATAFAFHMPAGELLVWLGAAFVLGYGAYQLYRAWVAKLSRQLDLSPLTGTTRLWIVAISRFGIAARGIIFCLIGFFLGRAAARHDAGEAGGIRESLSMLASLGRWPFVLVALGLIAYGVHELVNARYRRIRVAG